MGGGQKFIMKIKYKLIFCNCNKKSLNNFLQMLQSTVYSQYIFLKLYFLYLFIQIYLFKKMEE